ncbi:DUF4167 domain-containing protein [Novosphingobium profundi]|uniref:DUF4167 domain-containing protein n=1 Tax=Novosphingobium profundi TaxID=1774954 RepID=UPI001CFE3873|nr:DUF4167 domain-containing protein [Novosphingobium profundi]
MNNNRGNNRRRGRGNNRQQNGQQMNRIDSRARGNAPQLLEKYKKLAHDAMLNGDRVQEEYYHQFADHYFRVIADQKQRQEEARQPRRDDRGQDDGDSSDSYGDNSRDSGRERSRDNPRRSDTSSNEPRPNTDGSDASDDGEERGRSVYEPADNPFVRDNRSGTKTRKPRRGKDDAREDSDEADTGFDSSVLPPAIAASSDESDTASEAPAEDKPAKRTRAKKAAPAGDKPKTTRTRKTAAKSAPDAEGAGEAAGDETGEAKPRPRRRTTRKTASNDDTASSAAEAEA